MSGGGSQTSTVYQSSLPQYAKPFYESLMSRGAEESQRPYQPYQGQRLAGESGATQQGLQMATDYANSGPGSLPYAQTIAGQAAMNALNTTGVNSYTGPAGYTAGNFTSQNIGQGTGPYGYSNVTSQNFDQNAAQQYMSPYIQSVLQQQEQDEMFRTAQEQAIRNGQAATAGAFGGSRAAVQNQMAIDESQRRMQDLVTQGLQSAYTNAQSQFNADRGASLTAQQANQQAALAAAQANQQGNLQAQQYGEQSRQFGYGTDEQARQQAASLGLQAQQIGLQGQQQATQSAQALGELQGQQDSLALQHLQAQLGVGQTQENYTQQQLDQAYNDFVNQRDANRQNLQFLSSLLQGVPVSANQDVTQSSSGNALTGTLGTLTGLQALYQLGRST
jgi:hypothetical protein